MMIREAIVNGEKYQVDTTPGEYGRRYSYAEIYGIRESPASGVIAEALRELGKEPVTKTLVILDEEEKAQVVLSLGRKFSTSKAWQNSISLYAMKERQNRNQ